MEFLQQLIQFIIKHWLLVGLFVVILIWLFIEEARAKGMGSAGLNPQKLTHMINRESATVFDVRDVNAYKDGHIIGAVNVPQDAIDQQMNKINKYKQQPIVIVDGNGQKAMAIAAKLKKSGFEQVQVLTGGLNAWKTAGLPITKK